MGSIYPVNENGITIMKFIGQILNGSNVLIVQDLAKADAVGSDSISDSVEAAVGSTANATLTATFDVMLKNLKISGDIGVTLNITLELAQVDATYAGSASVDSIVIDVLENGASIASNTVTVGKTLSGVATTSETFSVFVPVSVSSSRKVKDLGIKVSINFSATTDASATTTTIAKVTLNVARGSEDMVVVVLVLH